MHLRPLRLTFLLAVTASAVCFVACVDASKKDGVAAESGDASVSTSSSTSGGGGATSTGSDATTSTTGSFNAGSGLNQCGVAAPAPQDTGECTTVSTPLLTNFDDYTSGAAESYTFYVNGPPPTEGSLLGGFLHIGDGSDASGSVIATEMVPGMNGEGYAFNISNDNALDWGGLMMVYFPSATTACLNASDYAGVEFAVKGSTPSGRIGVTLGMLDTIATADNGLCDGVNEGDCQDATVSLELPSDLDEWTRVQLPWSAFTPGIGSGGLCVPATGENLFRLVIQPHMNYVPPNWEFEPGPYSLTVDDISFYGTRNTSGDGVSTGTGECALPESLRWTASDPIIAPVSDASHDLLAVKDPSMVFYEDLWHVFASSVSTAGAYNLVYTSFADFDEAPAAPLYYMDQTPGFDTYVAAPQVFYFTPQNKWYLVFQSGPPMFSTNDDISDPSAWTAPQPFYAGTPSIISESGGGWLDYWVICESETCHLFFSSNQGRFYRAETASSDFPNGFGDPVVVMENSNNGRIFEGSNVYKMNGTDQFLAIIEAFDQTSNNHRYFRSWIADSLRGPWLPWQASGSYSFASPHNVSFEGEVWTADISHGEMLRAGYDETLAIDPCDMRYMFQGADPTADNEGDYNKIPWHLGLLTQAP